MASAANKHIEAIVAVILMVVGLVFALLATAFALQVPIPFMQDLSKQLLASGTGHLVGSLQFFIACLACLGVSVLLLREK